MTAKVLVIPARYASTRLPGKPLRDLAGKPMIQHVYERAQEAAAEVGFEAIIVATDDERIKDACESFGAEVCMTSKDHETGSDRLAEVVALKQWADDTIVVNLQGDEPLTPITSLKQVATNLSNNTESAIATLSTPIHTEAEYNDPNVVKVVTDKQGLALYFSRSPIPMQRDAGIEISQFAQRHIGIYAYRASYLKSFASMEPCQIENLEKLEQLRAMWHGARIHVEVAEQVPGHGVDTEDDLKAVEKILLAQ
ncbi:3-deoxy-manno-octulosonate cytidylyltransferase [Cocleimonas flava]|uniref:3-deoxy-manno-octulosonate cytidylyltransferase n=1 Tax=Cocleimonas flava TaxID=634765 RepID=A0A4R1F3Y7_9GAMM|nr:3-deoxy-manno-octulosonate cytidylyltransferase [Cocleimonas flava]TCJ87284.1 3-deoxy-manno-octulosonate cytidylyltransferase (CMP-KDO synthetase) [Cocleimonas flava]